MRFASIFIFTIIIIAGFSKAAVEEPVAKLRLATSQLSSKTLALEIETEHAVRKQMECVLAKMNFKPEIESKPWKRIYHDLQRGQLDGFFASIPSQQLDAYAEISVPLVLENWYWFWRPGIDAPASWQEGYRLGSILGSQQAKWLEEAGYKVNMTANHLPQLIKMLNTGRIDVILVDRDHFFQAVSRFPKSATQYESRFFRYMPLGAYFSEGFLQQHPNFMKHFNQQANHCSHQRFLLSDNEKNIIEQKARLFHQQWERFANWQTLLANFNKQRPPYDMQEIVKADKAWIEAFRTKNYGFMNSLIDAGLSQKLRELKNQSAGVITEIILTDAQGLNVAVTDMTSDFYQGDEDKFIEAKKLTSGSYFIDEIAYDASTRLFQVNVSLPLLDRTNNSKLIGVMIIGINIETALSLSH